MNPDQLNAMVGAGNNMPQADTQNAQPAWLSAMVNSGLKPNESAAALGHSTGVMSNFLTGARNALAQPLVHIGSAIDTGLDQTIGRGVNAITGHGFTPTDTAQQTFAPLQQKIDSENSNLTTAGKVGQAVGTIAPYLVPIGGEELAATGAAKTADTVAQLVGGSGFMSKLAGLAAKFGIRTAINTPIATAQTGSLTEGVKQGAEAAAGQQVGEAALGYAGKLLGNLNPTTFATKQLASTAENMTKGEREQAILQGRMDLHGNYTPSEAEQNAGRIMAGKITSNPVENLQAVQKEIATRGTQAEQYLGENGRHISNQEDLQMFADARAKVAKYLTPAQLNGYDDAIKQFQSELKGMGNMNTGTYYKALKNFESNVTANLPKGKEALLSDSVSGKVVGAKTVRTAVRDIIGQKHPDFKNLMYDLASLYEARDNVVANAEKGGASFAKQHPTLTKIGATAAGVAGYEEAKKLPIVGEFLP